MTCDVSRARRVEAPPGYSVRSASTSRDHADALMAAAEAFGDSPQPPSAEAIAARRKLTAAGGAVALAREVATGATAGSGVLTVPLAGVAEVTGIGTRPGHRRRGVAAAVVGLLVQRSLRNGADLVWLTPGDAAAERIYARVGFERLDVEMVHISLRPERPAGGTPGSPG